MTTTLSKDECLKRIRALSLRAGRPLSEKEKAALRRLALDAYDARATIREIAKEAGRSYGSIHRLLDVAGAQLRGPGNQKSDHWTTLSPRIAEAVQALTDGLTTLEIAARLDVRPNTALGYLHEAKARLGAEIAGRGRENAPPELVELYDKLRMHSGRNTAALTTVTSREAEAIQGLANGWTRAQTAARMQANGRLVTRCLSLAKRKLGAADAADCVARAYDGGHIPDPGPLGREVRVTPVQEAILPLLAQGRKADSIAAELRMTATDVRVECRTLRATLEAKDAAHLVTRARQYGRAS
ncbi:helix-turn-helix domain-containing protein [Streptomyces sp. NRRL F-5053]|uniref:helix-turn-helix domain-containing protein n=1 Tax=Streptomyces sp. NRRL F-5053 TaxID=1463854 RepID=UPI0004C71C4B|nr:helix-turn-helix domain-containing protein [Streptomyces sp. NRRL F-5053]